MTFRETQSLLNNESWNYRIRKTCLSSFNWKFVSLSVCAGVLPFLLWMTLFQNVDEPIQNSNPLLQQQPSILSLSSPSSEIENLREKLISSYLSGQELKSSPFSKKNSIPPPSFTTVGNRTVATYYLVVSFGFESPDNFRQPVILINGETPGPEIRVPQCSNLIVHLTNKLPVPVTIHFHGFHQKQSFLSDGVPHVTQNPIPPDASYTYEMDTWPQVGTYFYHAHTRMDILWLFGSLIIEDIPEIYTTLPDVYQFDEDRTFLINAVYHEPFDRFVDRLIGPVHDYPRLVSSLTINGRSFGYWDDVTGLEIDETDGPVDPSAGYSVTSVKKGLRYRFRFINAASDSIVSCNITSHTFWVIEAEGVYIDPIPCDNLLISPGQRYSVIVTMDQEDDNYYISCKHTGGKPPSNGLAILHYVDGPQPTTEMRQFIRREDDNIKTDRWILDQVTPNFALGQTDVYKIPEGVDKEFVIEAYEAVIGERHLYLMNGHSYEEPTIPYFTQLKNGLNISNPPQVFEIIEGDSVQFVFQNQRLDEMCSTHPWHIHGHTFYVVGEGPNKYDPVKDGQQIQENIKRGKKMQFRDTVTVYRNQTIGEETDGAYCGWAAVRFSANNNGIWLGHCHVTMHMIMGKKFVIWEHPEDDPQLSAIIKKKVRG